MDKKRRMQYGYHYECRRNGGKYQEAGIVHKGEVVWSQADIKRWGGVSNVESMRKSSPNGYADGGVVGAISQDISRASAITDSVTSSKSQSGANITINNNSGAKVNAQQNSDGSVSISVVDQMIKRSWQQLANANSRESKSVSRNTTARRNR